MVRKLTKKLNENDYLRNTLTLMMGSGLSQLIPFLMSVVLTRLFTKEDFGAFTLFSSIAAFLGVFTTMRYELTIMLPKKNSDAFNLVALSLGISFIVSIVVLIISLVFSYFHIAAESLKSISPWLYLLAVSIFLTSIVRVFGVWFNRRKLYKIISTNSVLQSSTTAASNGLLGFLKYTSGGLIFGSIIGQFVAAFRLTYVFVRRDRRLFKALNGQSIKRLAKEYSDYPKFNMPHSLIDMISITGLPILIATLFSEAVLGWYGLMLRALKAPLGILSASLGQVYFQQISENVAAKRSVMQLFKKMISRVALIILPFFILIIIWGPEIFSFVFGSDWRQAGVYAQYLTPWLFLSSVSSPVSQTPITLGYVKQNMYLGIFSNLLIVSIFTFAAYFFKEVEYAFLGIGIIMPVYLGLLIFWYYRIIRRYEKSLT